MGNLALPIISLALTAGGAAANGVQQQQYQAALSRSEQDAYKASKAARVAEQGRQDVFGSEAQQHLADTQAAITPEATAQAQANAEQKFMDLYDERGTTQPEGQYLSGQEGATDLIKGEIAKRAATASADARARVQALSKVASFDQAMQNNGLALQNNSALLNTLGGLRRGSLGVSGREQAIGPSQVLPGNNLLGPIMGAAGSMTAGMSGTPGGFGGFVTNPITGANKFNWNPLSIFTGETVKNPLNPWGGVQPFG